MPRSSLKALTEVVGNNRHYKRFFGRDGDKILFCPDFIRAIDSFWIGVLCRYKKAARKDFDGFSDFADGKNALEEYEALDQQLHDLVYYIPKERMCGCREHHQLMEASLRS